MVRKISIALAAIAAVIAAAPLTASVMGMHTGSMRGSNPVSRQPLRLAFTSMDSLSGITHSSAIALRFSAWAILIPPTLPAIRAF